MVLAVFKETIHNMDKTLKKKSTATYVIPTYIYLYVKLLGLIFSIFCHSLLEIQWIHSSYSLQTWRVGIKLLVKEFLQAYHLDDSIRVRRTLDTIARTFICEGDD